ncbi:MAG: type VI secretion system membrane subunit TssM [Moritella sp.]|uniref:type VI secretion system membrane subunit TssM n=1 Tax=Moritella sp. TaxID=78556 RepID=UPI0025F4DA53|nr:type VI secretion system membrane subunit TssM [Moritella sp.]NQZ92766.1 type VI secretion system membrane subunit TssM [Moritella sp.]
MMWGFLLLLSIVTNLLLLIMSRVGYVEHVIFVFAVINSMLFLLCYLSYRRSMRHRHVLSFQKTNQDGDGHSFRSNTSYKQKQSLKKLHKKFEHALHVLKHSDLVSSKKGKKALYDQPWFLLLGVKGAGKSALIQQSGLELIHTDNTESEEALRASLSALFHFSSAAVLIEADGDYVTEGQAHEEWLTLLKLLRHHRSKEPINGLILTIDIAEFLLLEEPQRNFRLMLFRERINEMIDYLGIIFPVYIVFSQCDKVSGFNAYFADLSESEKTKIFGTCLFKVNDKGWQSLTHLLKQRLTQLTKQLQQQLVDKLAISQEVDDKANIVAFSQQFTHAMGLVGYFVENLFKASAYKEQPLVAGIYFTSAGVQPLVSGDPDVDEYAQSVSTNHTGQQDVFTTRSYPQHLAKPLGSVFIQSLFKELVLPLQGVVRANRSATRFNLSLKATLVSSVMIGVVAGISFMLSAYFSLQADFTKNRLVIDDLVKSINTEANEDSTLTQSLTLLRQRFLALNDDANEFEYFLPYLALDEKRLLVKEEMEVLYFHVLNLRIEQELQPLLKSRMSVLAMQWEDGALTGSLRSEYYNLLKLSLMLSCEVERLDIPFATQQLVQLWQLNGEQAKHDDGPAFSALVATYLQAFNSPHEVAVSLQPWKSLKPTIKLARIHLANPFTADELYQIVLDDVPLQPALTINTVIPARFQSYVDSNTSVPWLYSQAGWDTYVQGKLMLLQQAQLQSDNDWVIAQQMNDAKLQSNLVALEAKIKTVKSRYFNDYASFWFDFVESIRYQRLSNIQETQATLNVLASPNGLFTELISNMAKHLYLFDRNSAGTQSPQRITALAKHFPILNQLNAFQQQSRRNVMFTQFQRNMLRVNKDLFAIISSYSINDAALAYTGEVLSTHQRGGQVDKSMPSLYKAWYDTQALLARFSQQSSVQLSYLLTEPLRQSWRYLFAQSRVALESKWQQQVYRYFQRGIVGHYPFASNGPDTSLSQLSMFFNRHDGQLWQFVARDLNPFIADFRTQKQVYSWLGLSLGINLELVDSLRDADTITNGFFSRDSEAPRINYRIMPTAKQSIAESYLHINGYEYRYRNEPEEWRHFVWPSRLNTRQASVNVVSRRTGHLATLKITGDWALFKLIDRAQVSPLAANHYRLNWPLQTRRGERLLSDYKIKVEPASFIFARDKLHNFTLPSSLFKAPESELISSSLDILPVDN